MPSRWLVVIADVPGAEVAAQHVHAVVSGWFDLPATSPQSSEGDHPGPATAGGTGHGDEVKPYSWSTVGGLDGSATAIEIGLLNEQSGVTLNGLARPGTQIRLGSRMGRISADPVLLARTSWAELASGDPASSWVLRHVSPCSFRRGNRTSPWAPPGTLLRGLARKWELFSGMGQRPLTHQQADAVWVSDLDGGSEVTRVAGELYSGFVGRVRYRCDVPEVARIVDPLFRLAPYAGVGSKTAWGLGAARLEPRWRTAGGSISPVGNRT